MKTITALLMATLIMCPCSSIMAKNPAASVTDKAQKTSISTIKDLDNGRLYGLRRQGASRRSQTGSGRH